MPKVYSCNIDTLDGACGVGNVYGFTYEEDSWYGPRLLLEKAANPKETGAGSNWLTAGFIGNDLCKDAYHQLKNKYKVVFQTPVRKNTNSDNDFIFCVFDTKRCKKSIKEEHNNQFNWPFKE